MDVQELSTIDSIYSSFEDLLSSKLCMGIDSDSLPLSIKHWLWLKNIDVSRTDIAWACAVLQILHKDFVTNKGFDDLTFWCAWWYLNPTWKDTDLTKIINQILPYGVNNESLPTILTRWLDSINASGNTDIAELGAAILHLTNYNIRKRKIRDNDPIQRPTKRNRTE